jgi:hypothetical protein
MTNQDGSVIPSKTDNRGELEDSWKCPYCGQMNNIRTTCLRCDYDRDMIDDSAEPIDNRQRILLVVVSVLSALFGAAACAGPFVYVFTVSGTGSWSEPDPDLLIFNFVIGGIIGGMFGYGAGSAGAQIGRSRGSEVIGTILGALLGAILAVLLALFLSVMGMGIMA